jgi:EmrB/QacA subfamily drug resistance transporter
MSMKHEKGAFGVPVLLSVGLGTFMSALDASVVNTVLPVIREAFHAPVETIQWVVTTYLLVMGGLLLTFGRLGDLRGHKRLYLSGFGVFLPASVLCGVAPTEGALIAARVLQGVGAAIIVSNAPAILIGSVHPSRLGQALGLQAAMTSLGLALGPSLGGWLTDLLGWRVIFFINLPVGAVAFLLAYRHIAEDERPPSRKEPFDGIGAALFLGAFFALQFALGRGEVWGWGSSATVAVFAGSAALGYLFIRREAAARAPMVDLQLFGSRFFSIAVGSALVNYVCVASILFLVPFYLIQGRGLSASKAGIIMTVQFLGMSLTAPVSGMISDRVGPRAPATAGMALMAGGLFLLSAMNGGTPLYLVAVSMTVTGVGVAIFVTPNNSAMLGAAPAGRKGIASGILATARLLGMATGVSIAGAILVAVVGGRATHELPPDRIFRAVHLGFLAAGTMASAGVVLSASRGDGSVTGPPPRNPSPPMSPPPSRRT